MSIHELISNYPKVAEIMKEVGFNDVMNPMMLQTAGRYMTLEKGAKMKKIEWSSIVEKFKENGFIIIKEGVYERVY